MDSAGRDILSRILYGGRNTLGGALIALGIALVLGVPTRTLLLSAPVADVAEQRRRREQRMTSAGQLPG